MYDKSNIFYKIINNEVPCTIVAENDNALVFQDINPQDKIHLLIIPKGLYINYTDFINKANNQEKLDFFNIIEDIVRKIDIKEGYKLIINNGTYAKQEVLHLHCHLLAKL